MYDLKKELSWSKLKVGAVITAALLLLLLAVFFAGGIGDLLSPKALITSEFRDVRGLRKGSPVWLSGIEVGSVENITLDRRYGTIVTISINRNVLSFLKKDASATIQTMGLLGDKYIELSSGSPYAQVLQPGEMIKGSPEAGMQDMIFTGGKLIEKMDKVVGELGDLVEMIGTGEGTLAKLLRDPGLYKDLRNASRQMASISNDLRNGKGALGKLLADDILYRKLLSAADSFETFSGKLDKGDGSLNRLLEDETLYNRLLGATNSFEEFSMKLNKGPGSLNKFAGDPQLYDNLAEASGRLSVLLRRLEEGQGTAGSLISDKQMEQDLKDTIRELKELITDIKKNPKRYFNFSIF